MTQTIHEVPHGIDPALVNAALQAYLKSDPGKPQAWIRHPNNLISVVAIVLSILGVVYGFYKDWKDSIDRNLQALTTITTELAKLDTDYFSAALQSTRADQEKQKQLGEIERSLGSRRFALLAQADRLTAELGQRVPLGQRSVLGVAFQEAYQLDKAVEYFEKTTTSANPPVLRVLGWRSIGLINTYRGPKFYQAAREAFYNAVHVTPELTDYGPVIASLEVYQQWSDFELKENNYREAIRILLDGKEQTRRYACQARQTEVLSQFDTMIQTALETIKDRDVAMADSLRGEIERAASGEACPQ